MNDLDAEPFRYIRLREPPYSDDDLARARRDAPRRRPTSTSATRTSRPRPPTPRGCASSSPRGLRDRRRRRRGGGFESTSTAAASSTAIATTLSPATLRPDARRGSRRPRRASRGRTTKWWNAPHASTSATSASFTSSTCAVALRPEVARARQPHDREVDPRREHERRRAPTASREKRRNASRRSSGATGHTATTSAIEPADPERRGREVHPVGELASSTTSRGRPRRAPRARAPTRSRARARAPATSSTVRSSSHAR